MFILKDQLDIKISIAAKKSVQKRSLVWILAYINMQFAPPPTTLGAAIIAHGTQGRDVTYVLSAILHRLQSSSLQF